MRSQFLQSFCEAVRHIAIVAEFVNLRSPVHKGMMYIKDMPPENRPRERIATTGAHALSDRELVSAVLGILDRAGRGLGCGFRTCEGSSSRNYPG